MPDHGLEHGQGRGDVVLVILEGVADRLADIGEGGEVHDRVGFLGADHPVDGGGIAEVDVVQADRRRDGRPVAVNEVVDDNGFMACGHQLPDAVAANIAGSADDEDFHRERVIDFRFPMARQICSHRSLRHHEVRSHCHHRHWSHRPERQYAGRVSAQPVDRRIGHQDDGSPVHGTVAGRFVYF